jgi:hypothetical protein
MLDIKDTPEKRSLVAVIERDAKATTGLNLAKRAFWHGGGFGLRVGGAGLGAGLALAGLGYGLDKAGEGYAKTQDPRATVRAVADAPRPTPAQLLPDAKPASGAPVVTDFVIFKTAPYGKGEIQSGWRFADSSQQKPSAQWCLYAETEPDGTRRDITIGEDGQRVALPTPSPVNVDLREAFASCVWSSSRTPDRQSISPPPHVISARAKG